MSAQKAPPEVVAFVVRDHYRVSLHAAFLYNTRVALSADYPRYPMLWPGPRTLARDWVWPSQVPARTWAGW